MRAIRNRQLSHAITTAFSATLVCAALFTGSAAVAQEQGERVRIVLPSQSLSASLIDIGAQLGISIAFADEQLANLRAPSVSGTYSAREVLDLLLKHSGLRYEFIDARTVRIADQADSGMRPISTSALTGSTGGTQTSAGQSEAIEQVLVTGSPIGESLAAGIQAKREASNIVDVISSDNIGQFPDQNSAAALSRMPAVAVQRDQGQERYIQVRGAPNRWTSVAVDGIAIIGTDESGSQRAFRFDSVPAVILKALQVNKTLTSDLPASAIVAHVDLQTASPFDRPGMNFQGDAGYGEMELGDGPQEQYGARFSWSNDTLGVIAGGSHYSREQVTDNREFDYDADGLPTNFDMRTYQVTRENNAGLLGIEWRPNEAHTFHAKTLYTEFNDEELRNQYEFELGDALAGTRGASSGDLIGVPVRGSFNLGNYENSNLVNTLGGDHALAGWDASWRINYTETENTTDLPMVMQVQTSPAQFPSVRYDLSNPHLPILALASTVPGASVGTFARGAPMQALDQDAFGMLLALPFQTDIQSESTTFKADAGRSLDLGGQEARIKFGAQYDDRDIDGSVFSGLGATPLPLIGLSAADYVTNRPWDSGFPRGFDVNLIDNAALRSAVDDRLAALRAAGQYDPANNISPADRYSIQEKLLASYGMMDFDVGPAQVVAGLRIEHLEQTIDGSIVAGEIVSPITVEDDATELFPSLNVKFALGDDTILRLAALRGIARPSFGQIRAGASISDTNGTVNGGNPALEPETTWGMDASLERYLDGAGIASLATFYRRVDNVLFNSTERVTDDRFDANGIDRTGYEFSTTMNGGEGTLYGVELSYQQQFLFLPGALSGFGFQGNIAYVSGEFNVAPGRDAPFPGTSENIVNTALFYEKYGLSARLSYQWRDDWTDTLSLAGFGDQFRKDYESLDLSVRYRVNEQFTVFVDANNLSDETYVAYLGDERHPTEVEQIGRRYMLGMRFTY